MAKVKVSCSKHNHNRMFLRLTLKSGHRYYLEIMTEVGKNNIPYIEKMKHIFNVELLWTRTNHAPVNIDMSP